ncbi:MAG: hypothetical protein SF182_15775 [Deltaproteobacteria bacterium]|nr:hypothetical protein [Deltaproteobacteria bacterium]
MHRADASRCAAQLSFWLPGLGQLYRRRWLRGVAFLAASWWLSDVTLAAWPFTPWCAAAAGSLAIGVWVAAVCDARGITDEHREPRRHTQAGS